MSRLIGDSCAAERPAMDGRAGDNYRDVTERPTPSRGRPSRTRSALDQRMVIISQRSELNRPADLAALAVAARAAPTRARPPTGSPSRRGRLPHQIDALRALKPATEQSRPGPLPHQPDSQSRECRPASTFLSRPRPLLRSTAPPDRPRSRPRSAPPSIDSRSLNLDLPHRRTLLWPWSNHQRVAAKSALTTARLAAAHRPAGHYSAQVCSTKRRLRSRPCAPSLSFERARGRPDLQAPTQPRGTGVLGPPQSPPTRERQPHGSAPSQTPGQAQERANLWLTKPRRSAH